VSGLLVDTHAALWWLDDAQELSPSAREAIADPGAEVLISAASVWEIALKRSLGKLRAPVTFLEELRRDGFETLSISAEHGLATASLPWHHRDPFDRMLVAQAVVEGLVLVTADERLARYDVPVLW
jgi:PIN domain nuclease of toxin-antitoxin system